MEKSILYLGRTEEYKSVPFSAVARPDTFDYVQYDNGRCGGTAKLALG